MHILDFHDSHIEHFWMFETKCFQKMLNIKYTEHETTEYVKGKKEQTVKWCEPIFSIVKRRKVIWFSHLMWHDTLATTIVEGWMEGARVRGRPGIRWMDNIKKWRERVFQSCFAWYRKDEPKHGISDDDLFFMNTLVTYDPYLIQSDLITIWTYQLFKLPTVRKI